MKHFASAVDVDTNKDGRAGEGEIRHLRWNRGRDDGARS
jgi:hypothetical protein